MRAARGSAARGSEIVMTHIGTSMHGAATTAQHTTRKLTFFVTEYGSCRHTTLHSEEKTVYSCSLYTARPGSRLNLEYEETEAEAACRPEPLFNPFPYKGNQGCKGSETVRQRFRNCKATLFPPRGFRLLSYTSSSSQNLCLQSALFLDGERCPSDGT